MPAKGTKKHAREERLEAIRILVMEDGEPRWKVYRMIQEGYGVTARTVRRDLAELAKRLRDVWDCPEWAELEVRKSFEAFERIAASAEGAGKFHAAIMAHRERLKLLGVRTDRWASLAPSGSEPLDVTVAVESDGTTSRAAVRISRRAQELLEAPEEALEARAQQLRERFQVLDGERGDAPEEASRGLAG